MFFLPRYFNQLRNINNKTLSNAVFLKIQGQLIFRFSRLLYFLVFGSFSGKVYLGPGHVFVLCKNKQDFFDRQTQLAVS